MAGLVFQPNFTSNYIVKDMGQVVPPWAADLQPPTSHWWSDPAVSPNAVDFFHSRNPADNNAPDKYNCYIQFGQNIQSYASARFFQVFYDLTNIRTNSDGSITVTISISFPAEIRGVKADHTTSGWSVTNSLKVGTTTVFTHTGNTMDNYHQSATNVPVVKTVTIAPQTSAQGIDLEYDSIYPNHEAPDAHIVLGFKIFNSNPATYVPMEIRKSGAYKSLNTNHGFIRIRHSNAWVDRGQENINTSKHENTGHNRIRRSSKWLQLPPM